MDNEPFISRWSKRKLEEIEHSPPTDDPLQLEDTQVDEPVQDTEPEQDKEPSIAGLLASHAAQETKKLALRKLFLSGEFSEVDRLNDYDHDYSAVKPLASEIAQQLREWWKNSEELIPDDKQMADVETPEGETEDLQNPINELEGETKIPHKK